MSIVISLCFACMFLMSGENSKPAMIAAGITVLIGVIGQVAECKAARKSRRDFS